MKGYKHVGQKDDTKMPNDPLKQYTHENPQIKRSKLVDNACSNVGAHVHTEPIRSSYYENLAILKFDVIVEARLFPISL
jgi:hypothetical protein